MQMLHTVAHDVASVQLPLMLISEIINLLLHGKCLPKILSQQQMLFHIRCCNCTNNSSYFIKYQCETSLCGFFKKKKKKKKKYDTYAKLPAWIAYPTETFQVKPISQQSLPTIIPFILFYFFFSS